MFRDFLRRVRNECVRRCLRQEIEGCETIIDSSLPSVIIRYIFESGLILKSPTKMYGSGPEGMLDSLVLSLSLFCSVGLLLLLPPRIDALVDPKLFARRWVCCTDSAQ